MAHRLEENHRTISWTVTSEILVGYHNCGVCGVETPEPTMAQMIEFAQERNGNFMWPDPNIPGCMPPGGWSDDNEEGLICPACTEAKNQAFAFRRKK